MYTYTCMCVHMYMYVYICVHMCAYVYVCWHSCGCVDMSGNDCLYIDVCEKYAKEFNIKFNGSKSRLLLFKGRNYIISTRGVTVNGVSLTVSETAVHLGHHMSTKEKECTVNAAKNSFWRSFNLFISDYGHIYSFLKKVNCLDNIAVVTMGHLCGHCKVMELSLCVCFLEKATEDNLEGSSSNSR